MHCSCSIRKRFAKFTWGEWGLDPSPEWHSSTGFESMTFMATYSRIRTVMMPIVGLEV